MATTIRSNGLQHAISLGNIEISTKTNSIHTPTRCYDSEDENMGRTKNRPQTASGFYPRTSVYSKGDIREQYCLTDRQLNSIERPRRERFFGCWSGRGAPQSFLGVCVGRRAPSDENLADYAPFYKYPRYHPHDILQYDEDLESSYFRRRPTSILSSGSSTADPKRYTWMPADDESVRLEGPRPICPEYDDYHRGPYVVGSYPPKQYLSQSTEHITGLYRCPAHIGLPPPPPPPVVPVDGVLPRTKHVSFARSHTLTSFDEAASLGLRSSGRMSSTRSQERLIGGKKPCLAVGSIQQQQQQQQQQIAMKGLQMNQQQQQQILQSAAYHHLHHHPLLAHPSTMPSQSQSSQQQQKLQPLPQPPPPSLQTQSSSQIPSQSSSCQQVLQPSAVQPPSASSIQQTGHQLLVVPQQPQPHLHHHHPLPPQPEVVVVEKIKRGAMKTQATQTEVYLGRKGIPPHHLSLSPRTIHRVKMVSQGAQTNGMVNGRKLTKSLSEMTGTKGPPIDSLKFDDHRLIVEHEQLHRTQSEEPPRSPSMVPPTGTVYPQQRYLDPSIQSRTSSRTSDQPPSSFDYHSGNSRNLSQDSAMSHRSTDPTCIIAPSSSSAQSIAIASVAPMTSPATKLSQETNMNFSVESTISDSRSSSRAGSNQRVPSITGVDVLQGLEYESNSLPRRTCSHHRMEEYYTYSLPRREQYHAHEICRHVTECTEFLNGTVDKFRFDSISRENSTDSNQNIEKRRASMIPDITPKTHATLRRQSMPHFMHPYYQIPPPLFMTAKGMQSEDESDHYSTTDRFDKEQDDESKSMQQHEQEIKNDIDDTRKVCDMEESTQRQRDDEEEEEQEIFIDFKPHISPTPSPCGRRKKLQKTLSDGEILLEKQRRSENIRDSVLTASASEEDIKQQQQNITGVSKTKEYQYQNVPIKDEGICDKQNLLTIPPPSENDLILRSKREAFRKRSISLEDPTATEEIKHPKSAPPSPCQDELSVHVQSGYPSSDSLANDLTRDHSDGIWNESQATVLPAENRDEFSQPLLTPSSRRKHLILQHQQRSSVDTDAIDLEEQFSSDQSVPYIPSPMLKPASTQTITQTQQVSAEAMPSTTTIAPSTATPSTNLSTPSIAVTPSLSIEGDDHEVPLLFTSSSRRSSRTLSPALQERRKIEPLVHTHSPHRHSDTSDIPQYLMDGQSVTRSDSGPKNNTDISECSTNTDEYVTCTDNSKRVPGMKTPTTASSSTSTQVPVSAQSSQTATHDGGSSFESASSLYSTRGDGLSEEAPLPPLPPPEELEISEETLPPPSTTTLKSSPAHSVSSSSSGSYNLTNLNRSKAAVKTSPVRASALVKPSVVPKKKPESISDDERSERRYSSSGYYESPHDEEHRLATKYRRTRERVEEERRRRRNNMKLDIERENLRALTSPIKRPSPGFKQISPEDRTAMNVLDGASPSKTKRFRPKIRRQLRKTSMSREDSTPRKSSKATSTRSPEKMLERSEVERATERIIERPIEGSGERTVPERTTTFVQQQQQQQQSKTSPSKYEKVHISPKKLPKADSGSEKRLKAKSIESLRSVSPGSDSVFYSEADIVPDQQVHCLHCGKEVEIVTAASGSQDSIAALDDDGPDIVKPPADFADSPITTKTSQRLYKKMDKRFRSEERHGDRRHYRNRQENVRAKSEERGKEQSTSSPPATLRPSGSSPCVMPADSTESRRSSGTELDQIIYRGHYRVGLYTRLTDSDVWIQLDHQSFDRHRDRHGSTDSEKAFHQKYQVILHRLVQRRCTLEMYQRQKTNSFTIDKTVVVSSDSGEFGFRIHGSKPVVVAAIEPDTPAESSGLEVGDIIISVNGIPVLDKHHTEVVKIAHAGCETLELEVARTIGVLMNEQQESASPALYTGYLWRQSGQVKGSPNSKKWVRRWFCLRPDHCLYYYKTDTDTQPVGAVILTNHKVEHCSPDVGKPYAFKIDSGEGIPLLLAAESQEAADRWVAVMSHASTQGDPWLEMSTRNLRLPPNGISRPDCYGYLMKLGSRWCGWSKRYCVLKDACLYFYQDSNSKNSFGMACLQGYKVVAMSTNTAGRKNAFEVVPPDQKLRHYYFSAESDMDKKRWISALEYSIDRWIKAG